ncbi:Uncharacterised protein [Bordetella pertussis]|nr:Uncharacterised protein [Bordetella pertussis]
MAKNAVPPPWMLTAVKLLYGMPFSARVAAHWNHTAEPGAMPTRLPARSFQSSIFTPLRVTRYLGDDATPARPTILSLPYASAMARSAGPMPDTSIEPDSSAVRASA